MPEAIFNSIALGDLRPVEVTIAPSDTATIASAGYKITRFRDPPGVIFGQGTVIVVPITGGFRLSTATFILFSTIDTYTVTFRVVWSDGQVDNSIAAVLHVRAPNAQL